MTTFNTKDLFIEDGKTLKTLDNFYLKGWPKFEFVPGATTYRHPTVPHITKITIGVGDPTWEERREIINIAGIVVGVEAELTYAGSDLEVYTFNQKDNAVTFSAMFNVGYSKYYGKCGTVSLDTNYNVVDFLDVMNRWQKVCDYYFGFWGCRK